MAYRAMHIVLAVTGLVVAAGCQSDGRKTGFAVDVAYAHGAPAWRAHESVQTDITVDFMGNRLLDGIMTMTTDTGKVRIETSTGHVMVYDGQTAWLSPSSARVPMVRFHLLTWPYFAAAPYKLDDPGSTLTPLGPLWLDAAEYDAAELTFDAGVGDTPDDWYVCYRDLETNRLAAMAYIVTYGSTVEKAGEEPHAITYHDFQNVRGAVVAMTWKFWQWDREQGIHGDPIGEVRLANLRFINAAANAYQRPMDAVEEVVPVVE